MNLRLYTPADYSLVCEWWRRWKWDCLPESSLPDIGVIVDVDGVDTCAAWLVETNCDLAMIEWFISNPAARKNRREALSLAVHFLMDIAKSKGFAAVVSTVRNPHLIRSLESMGFEGSETNMTNLIRIL